jgi:hypothetical protein
MSAAHTRTACAIPVDIPNRDFGVAGVLVLWN